MGCLFEDMTGLTDCTWSLLEFRFELRTLHVFHLSHLETGQLDNLQSRPEFVPRDRPMVVYRPGFVSKFLCLAVSAHSTAA